MVQQFVTYMIYIRYIKKIVADFVHHTRFSKLICQTKFMAFNIIFVVSE